MTYAVGNYNYDEITADIKSGTFDSALDELDLVIHARKAERDKWQPINDLLTMLRRIEQLAIQSLEAKATAATEMNMQVKAYLDHPDPAVRGLAGGVRQRIYVDLLGMSPERAVGL